MTVGSQWVAVPHESDAAPAHLYHVSCTGHEPRVIDCDHETAAAGSECIKDVAVICWPHPDDCLSNPCMHGGTCLDLNKAFSCSCPMGFTGDRCEHKPTTISCGTSSMEVVFDKAIVPLTATVDQVHFEDPMCTAERQPESGRFTLTTSYNECGTTTNENATTITYRNIATYAVPQPIDDNVITREHQMQVVVECSLPKEAVLTEKFIPHLGKVVFNDKGTGDFSLEMSRLPNGDSFVGSVDPDSEVMLSDMLFFGVALDSTQRVGMVIDRCWATPSPVPSDTIEYTLISDKCPESEGVTVNTELRLSQEIFSVSAFTFIGDFTEVYVHCSVLVCRAGKAKDIRADLDAECAGPRVRRSASRPDLHTISNGPIHVRRSARNLAAQDFSFKPYTTFLLGAIATAGGLLLLLVITKLLGKSKQPGIHCNQAKA